MTNRFIALVAVLGAIAAGLMNADQAATSNAAPSAQEEGKALAFEIAAIKPSDPLARNNGCFMKGQPGGQTFVGRCIHAHTRKGRFHYPHFGGDIPPYPSGYTVNERT